MIHEIAPHRLDNQYKAVSPKADSKLLIIEDNKILVKESKISNDSVENSNVNFTYPMYSELSDNVTELLYAFSVDETAYFLAKLTKMPEGIGIDGEGANTYTYYDRIQLRDAEPVYECLAGMTGIHLDNWYLSVKFCGKCGSKNMHHPKLRAMQCPKCGTMFFPKISPAIIVAVTHDDKLLLTKYAGRAGANYALVAGFIEIGETAEECVRREVMEEVGIQIKNVRYYDSQPWGYDGNLMLAYTAEADETEITLDKDELATAVWLSRDEIPETTDHSSLTREIIRRFKHGEI